MRIPVVDLGPALAGEAGGRRAAAEALAQAAGDSGFF
jgi:isopenicillin N synthase-like dioxygenase